ncbi:uncharacterized protein DNG_06426 [Cephalotrichum gorgonifer]|uniref:CCD97-like C-terminal domain-containing protein n=1 Tax=Cephalotrichum gorgonifer TaxID=2041049 RepID=A0AAE8N2D4_9PEZI|nr:uncharacterized protein DNG_06426 [Cephalotrichum gorgonifer]
MASSRPTNGEEASRRSTVVMGQPQPDPEREPDQDEVQHHPRVRSPETVLQIRVRNRRREHLRLNPSYLADLEHELAHPVKYEALIRRFQSQAEKDAEAKTKGYSRVLEGDLMRGEAKIAALIADSTEDAMDVNGEGEAPANSRQDSVNRSAAASADYDNGVDPMTKEEGRELWNEFITDRFVKGEDPDFDYSKVDDDDDLDTMERQDAQDAWFDDEEPTWAVDAVSGAKAPHGETGIQDF